MKVSHDNTVLEIECVDNIQIYNLKLLISKKINIPVDEIHIIKNSKDYYDNTEYINGDMLIELKIIKNRCAICLKKAAIIVGDCKFCECKYCSNHRLPEVHKCPKMETCKKESFDTNYKTVISQKCVASMVSY